MKRRYFFLSLVSLGLVTGCSTLQRTSGPDAAIAPSPSAAQPTAGAAPAPASASNPSPEVAQAADPGEKIFAENGVAIRGADPVAYFKAGQPVLGSNQFTHIWRGATWRFSSAENRDLFAANPEQYAPQFGGFCAYAVANGYTASIVPEAWTVVDGKLYLNFSLRVRDRWERDIPGNIARGNANWPDATKDFRG